MIDCQDSHCKRLQNDFHHQHCCMNMKSWYNIDAKSESKGNENFKYYEGITSTLESNIDIQYDGNQMFYNI